MIVLDELLNSLRECSDELSQLIEATYDGSLHYPDQRRRYDRDMEPVQRARRLIAQVNGETA